MSFHFKAFIIVLLVTMATFAIAKSPLQQFISAKDYSVRRNAWLALTTSAFVLPNFWLFIAATVVIVAWASRRDSNPVALYMFLLLCVPPIREVMPGLGGAAVIVEMDHLRVLSMVVLLPLAIGMATRRRDEQDTVAPRTRVPLVAGVLIVAYQFLQLGLFFPYSSLTANLRSLVLVCFDWLLPYFVVSRYCRSKETIAEVMASFALAAFVLVPLALFEFAKGWLLYQGIEDRWGTTPMIGYLLRGDSLRAQVSAGHPIVLGFGFAIAFGFWLYLRREDSVGSWRWVGVAALIGGLGSTLSRGPWIGALVAFFVFRAMGPGAAVRTVKSLVGLCLAILGVLVTPYAEKFIELIPFVGSVDAASVTYRQQILGVTWRLIQQSPFFGTPFYMSYMEELRQGQGIIDIVNHYAAIAVSTGLIGLALFAGAFGVLAFGCLRVSRVCSAVAPDFSTMGAGLFASLVGALLILATTSFYLTIPTILYTLAALIAGYVRVGERYMSQRQGVTSAPLAMHIGQARKGF